jgi:hypothetical protein
VSTTNLLNIDGQKSSGAGTPDANGAVGATQFVQTVNTSYTVYNKTTGAIEFGPFDLSTIWTSLGGLCSMGTTGATRETDPVVLYDKPAARWVISEIAFTTDRSDNMACWAVSTTSDATGSYHLYSMDFGRNFPDYPKMATWPDAYYTSFNMFTNCSQRSGCTLFQGAKVCALNRSAMLQGLSMSAQCFQRATEDMSFLPSDLDGKTLPPSGSPNYFVEILGTGSTLLVFKFHVDFTNSADTTFSRVGGVSGIAPFSRACGGDFPCIPQPSPGELLDSVGDRLMFRLAYRNFGTHESLVVNHSVNPGIGPASAVRWYEIRSPGSSPFVFQQGTVTTANSLWVGSIAMDKNGDIAVGYSESATILDPSVFYTGRVSSDPKGTMETPKMVVKGTGVQERTTHRWGDYSSMSVDPANDCTFWYTRNTTKQMEASGTPASCPLSSIHVHSRLKNSL